MPAFKTSIKVINDSNVEVISGTLSQTINYIKYNDLEGRS